MTLRLCQIENMKTVVRAYSCKAPNSMRNPTASLAVGFLNPLFAYMKKNFKSKWRNQFDWYLKVQPNYRQRLINEIVLESDFPLKETNFQTAKKAATVLKEKGYSWQLWFGGNKSYHLHLQFEEWLSKPMIKAWVCFVFDQTLAGSFDDSCWSEKALIGIENRPHRNTGKLKTLVDEFEPFRLNTYPKEILITVKRFDKIKTSCHSGTRYKGKCAVCEYAVENEFPIGVNRHQHLLPNMVSTIDKKLWPHAAATQKKQLTEFEGWHKKGVEFNCRQMQSFAKKHDINFLCEVCCSPLKRGFSNGK